MSVQCTTCGEHIETPPTMPLRIQEEADGPVVATDYTAVYEHIRDAHPDQWTEELAAGFESPRRGSRH